jgi:flavin-dependent dehydrogenase
LNAPHYIHNRGSFAKLPREKGVIVIGGGISGLISANLIARSGIPVTVIEKRSYPFHRVCGEYISNETLPFLKRENLFPKEFDPPIIKELQLTSVNGRSALIHLGMGGFGISRYNFDNFLYQSARKEGAVFLLNTEATSVSFKDDAFEVRAGDALLTGDVVLGSFGKRSRLDRTMNRSFVSRRSPYAGIKYHIEIEHPASRIALHNFSGGYCGISSVEGGLSNLCYLTHRDNLKEFRNIRTMEEYVLFQNPFLREIFERAKFVSDNPEVINEISFETKTPVEEHVLMAGDAAGMITPLCGNGMAMAIRSAAFASSHICRFVDGTLSREQMEDGYAKAWNAQFANRLWVGRMVQRLFGGVTASNLAVGIARHAKGLTQSLVGATHGKEF